MLSLIITVALVIVVTLFTTNSSMSPAAKAVVHVDGVSFLFICADDSVGKSEAAMDAVVGNPE